MSQLHPDVVAYLAQLGDPGPQDPEITPASARAQHRKLAAALGPGRPLAAVENVVIPGPAGAMAARLYRPTTEPGSPLLLFLHGGGWIGGDLDTHDVLCRELAHGGGCAVMALDYRLAPEHPFPAGYEDCLAAACWCLDHAAPIGVDPARVAIGGDSAGGNLAAGVAQHLRGRLVFQLLIYPFIDMRPSASAFAETLDWPGFGRQEAEWCVAHYLPDADAAQDLRASPAMAPDLAGLPPAQVLTAEIDTLREDGEAYALAMARAGVPVRLRRHLGVPHGFISAPPSLGVTADALADVCAALRQAFG